MVALLFSLSLAAAGPGQAPQAIQELSPPIVAPPTFPPLTRQDAATPAARETLPVPAPILFAQYPATPAEPKVEIDPPSDAPAPRPAGASDAAKPPAVAGWDNGFFLRSADKRFQLRITGQIQTDYKDFIDQPDTTDINTFLLRRARFGIEANVFQFYEFRFLPDFGQGAAVIQDSYLNVHYWDAFQVEGGRFKQPFSYEQLIQDRFVPTLERSMIDQLVPQRDWGAMIHGQKLFQDRMDWAVSVHNGMINGNVADNNNPKDVSARVAFRPLNCDVFAPWLRLLQIGMSFNSGDDVEAASPGSFKTPLGVPWFTYLAGTLQNGWRNRYSPEVSYFFGPLGFASQYLTETQMLRAAAGAPVMVPMQGYFALATLLLTGETRTTYSAPVVPVSDFDPSHPFACPGAWELVVRTSRLVVDPIAFQPGVNRLADPTKNSGGATELTTGFNWYLNTWVRVQFNWERAWFDQPVPLAPAAGAAGLRPFTDTLAARFQVIF
ncbi:MAG TPA: porin [Gemmataceae bacterium]|nr:porin [Gemmataceae bacterium]